ncbi:MAG: ATP-binding domain-containing protein, partial [Clostridia bacterium]|nr:ATP-binding domain-containing protein [Clostridia bacterium]
EKVLEDTGYMAALKSLGEEGADRIENVNELLSNIVNYERENENASLSGFLEEISLITDMDREEEDDNQRVSLMTMHTAKGLEYPVVYIIGVEEGIFPGNQSIYAGESEIEEERRLAYVGITRAKERLFISNAYQRMLFGRTERMRESRFVGEINRELIERKMSNEMQSYGYGSYNNNNSYSRNNYGDTKVSYYEPKKPTSTPIARSSSFGPTQNKTNYSVGERVKHKTFGEGMITSVTNMGNDSMLEIAFDSVGTKKVMANFARLEKI